MCTHKNVLLKLLFLMNKNMLIYDIDLLILYLHKTFRKKN